MPLESGRSQNSTSDGITGKWAGLSLGFSNPVSPTISHATAEYTPRQDIVNKKFEDLQVFLNRQKRRILKGKINLETWKFGSLERSSAQIHGRLQVELKGGTRLAEL